MLCNPPPIGHQFRPSEEVFFEKAGPHRKEWFRVYRCACGEQYGKHESMSNAEKEYWMVKNAWRALRANEPKPEEITQELWEALKASIPNDQKSS